MPEIAITSPAQGQSFSAGIDSIDLIVEKGAGSAFSGHWEYRVSAPYEMGSDASNTGGTIVSGLDSTTIPVSTDEVQHIYVALIENNVVIASSAKSFTISPDADGDGVNDDEDAYPFNSNLSMADYAPAKDIYGSVAFEDLWPTKGDYDFNDVVVDYQYKYGKGSDGKVKQINAFLKIYSNAQYQNGIGLIIDGMADKIESVSGVGLVQGISVGNNGTEIGNGDDAVIIITTNQKHDRASTMNVTIVFNEGIDKAMLGDAPHNLFIFSKSTRGREIHLPGHKHSAKMDTSLFNTGDDSTSEGTQATAYKTSDDLPWALHIAEKFDHPKGGKSIHEAYTKFSDWAQSGGTSAQDWFSNSSYRDSSKIKDR
jgi:LruC domain-containing protein